MSLHMIKIRLNPLKYIQIPKIHPKSSKIHQNQLKYIKIHPKLPKIHQNTTKSSKIPQNTSQIH